MAQYDGSIRIGTQIDVKGAEKELKSLESSVSKTAEKIASLRSKMDALKETKAPTPEYKKLQKELDSTIAKYTELDNRINDFKKIGMDTRTDAFRKTQDEAQELYMKIEDIRGAMFDLEESGKAFTLGSDTEKYAQMEKQMQQLNQQMQADTERQSELQSRIADKEERLAQLRENAVVGNQRIVEAVERRKQLLQEIADLEAAGVTRGYKDYDERIRELERLEQEIKEYSGKTKEMAASYQRLGQSMKQWAAKAGGLFSSLKDSVKGIDNGIKRLGEKVKSVFSRMDRSAKKSSTIFTTMASRFKGLALSLLIFNQITKTFNAVTSSIKEGYENLYKDNEIFKKSVDELHASVLTLKDAFAAAFRPLVDIAVPYIQAVADKMTQLLDRVGQFVAAVTGQDTYTRAIRQTADALKEEAEAAKKTEGYLSKLDEINKYSAGKNSADKDKDSQTGVMFEEAPVSAKFKEMAEKLKDIMSKVFAPIAEAWEREGQFVMDSWKHALQEVGNLLKSIGSDFLEVWQQEKTVKIFENILHIIGDIGLVAGNLAHNFREAWEENETGLHILENIRDIIGVIVENIRHAADATVEWSKNLDFSPLLAKMQEWTASLIPVFDTLSGIVTDFYERVLLPLGKWTIEKGLPELLQVLIDFNNMVDWESLRTNLAEFWEHLEPFAETVGEGLIIFIGRLSESLAGFINSPALSEFLTMIENWMDSVTPEDVASGFEKIAVAIVALKVAATAFSGISAAFSTFSKVATVLKGVLAVLSPVISALGSAISFLASPVGIALAAVAALTAGFVYLYNHCEEFKKSIDTLYNDHIKPFFDSIIEGVGKLKEKFMEFWDGYVKPMLEEWGEKFGILWEEHIKPALDKIVNAVGRVFDALKELWEEVIEPLAEWIIDNVLPVLLPIIDEVFNTALDLIAVMFDAVGDLADIIADCVELVVDLLQGDWSGAWEHAKSIVKTVWDGITGIIEGAVEKITGWIDNLLSLFGQAEGKGAFSGRQSEGYSNMARSMSAMSSISPYAANPAFAALANAPIPRLATGTVIPANKEFLAVLGDQKHGTNLEAPADLIEEITERSVANALSKIGLGENLGNSNPQTIIVKLIADGKELTDLVINNGKVRQMATGSNIFLLGTT